MPLSRQPQPQTGAVFRRGQTSVKRRNDSPSGASLPSGPSPFDGASACALPPAWVALGDRKTVEPTAASGGVSLVLQKGIEPWYLL